MDSKKDQTASPASSSVSGCVSCPHCGKAIDPPELVYSVTFLGGAADRTRLDLANIPMTLRVVVDAFGNVDALDADGDEPRVHTIDVLSTPLPQKDRRRLHDLSAAPVA